MAPLALAAAFLALVVIVTGSTGDDEPSATPPEASTTQTGERTTTTRRTTTEPRTTATQPTTTSTTPEEATYRVEPGDSFGSISEETGVSVAELEELNPGVDSQSLTVGQSIRLRR